MIKSECKWCGNEIVRRGKRAGVFCSLECKAEWQRTQKPVTCEWLREQYVDNGLSTYKIAKLVDRDPKNVYRWLIDCEIKTRKREWAIKVPKGEQKLYWNRDWLFAEYVTKEKSAAQIADEQNCTERNILYFLEKNKIARRTMQEIRSIKYWGSSGETNWMYGRRGAEVPNWKGGVTPERQTLYSSREWIEAASEVWKRDNGICQKCGVERKSFLDLYHIHHIVPFADSIELRTEISNLILLCAKCHLWVHGNDNVNQEFIEKAGDANDRTS